MTTHDCGTGCGRPATSHICSSGEKSCANQLEDSLAMLGAWAKAPEPLLAWCDLKTRDVHANYGRQPSTPFDIVSGHNAAGGTKGLAQDLDPQRARQSRRGSMNGPRLAPGSKVWWPWQSREWDLDRLPPGMPGSERWRPKTAKLDQIERELALAVAHWIGLLHGVNVSAPRAVTTGHVLARGCTWLLWHVRDILAHPEAASAFVAFTRAAKNLEHAIDLPPEKVYVGPCWRWVDEPFDGPAGAFGPVFAVECQSDLYADPAQTFVTCPQCLNVVEISERKQWLVDHVEDELATRIECLQAVAMLVSGVNVNTFKSWVSRGQIPAHGYVMVGAKRENLYRVGDVIAMAVRPVEERRRGPRKVSA